MANGDTTQNSICLSRASDANRPPPLSSATPPRRVMHIHFLSDKNSSCTHPGNREKNTDAGEVYSATLVGRHPSL